jgi:hypothetical protein
MKISMQNRFTRLVPIAVLVAIVALFIGAPVLASHVVPVPVAGNPTCADLGYAFGFKPQPEPPPSGTYTIPGTSETIIISSDGTIFAWQSTLPIDAVIVKGGDAGNVYTYVPEETIDQGLHSPFKNGNIPAISHIEFCYDFEVRVSKTATTTFTRTFAWTIDKTVTPTPINMFNGDDATVEYTVAVTKDNGTDSNWAVSGTITIFNPAPIAATITGVSDVISGGINAAVNCGGAFPQVLAAGATRNCSYSSALPDGTNRTNTATVTTSGSVGGGTGTAPVTFGAPTTVVNDSINVEDSNGSEWFFNASDSVNYTATFHCGEDAGTHGNTATIVETGQSDSASVTVNCYELGVTKTAATAYTRHFDWTIEKSADQSDLLLADGQLFASVNYEVEVSAVSTNINHAVSGTIAVNNPAPIAATINTVADIISPNVEAIVVCGVTFPHTLAAGGTLNCTYSANLPNGDNRTNTATASLQNYSYDKAGVATANGTSDFSGIAAVDFATAVVTDEDECINVSDDNVGVLGKVCADDADKTFNYSLTFGNHPDADVVLECGENTHVNIASFVTNDTGSTGSDNATVTAEVECGQGCTLTQGYWRTHSANGPAPYDETWALLGEATPFFLSGKTYYEALWTAPAGNAYYILARQYIAAKLNQLNGASIPANVLTAFNQATTLFETYTPAQIAAAKGKSGNDLRAQFVSLGGILGGYNEGASGPGHCDEDSNSASN